jgi:type II secretory pathway component PulM
MVFTNLFRQWPGGAVVTPLPRRARLVLIAGAVLAVFTLIAWAIGWEPVPERYLQQDKYGVAE